MVTPETVISHIEKLFLKRLISVVLKTIKTIRERRFEELYFYPSIFHSYCRAFFIDISLL